MSILVYARCNGLYPTQRQPSTSRRLASLLPRPMATQRNQDGRSSNNQAPPTRIMDGVRRYRDGRAPITALSTPVLVAVDQVGLVLQDRLGPVILGLLQIGGGLFLLVGGVALG